MQKKPRISLPDCGTVFSLVVVLLGAAVAVARPQVRPDEIRVTTRPYVAVQRALHVETREVQVSVIVRGVRGGSIPNLKAEDFQLLDQGKVQKISGFFELHADADSLTPAQSGATDTGAPNRPASSPARFIALFFDDLNSEAGDLRRAQLAAERFVNRSASGADRVAVFSNSGDVFEDFSADREKIVTAIEKLHGHPRVPERGLQDCPRIDAYEAYLISNQIDSSALGNRARETAACYQMPFQSAKNMVTAFAQETWGFVEQTSQSTLSSLQAAIAALAKTPGQRLLIVDSSGFLTQTLERQQDAIIAQALRSSVVIDSVDARGLYTVDNGTSLSEPNPLLQQMSPTIVAFQHQMEAEKEIAYTAALAELADSTGGRFFHNNNDLSSAYADASPQVTYMLSFVPDLAADNGKYHKLKVKLAPSLKYDVQSRSGYFAPSKNAKPASALMSTQEKLDKELTASDSPNGVPLDVKANEGKLPSGASVLWVDLHVDIRPLKFQQESDRHVQQLTFITALLDSHGVIVEAKQSDVLLALRDGSFQELSSSGLGARLYLEAAPGNYSLREVVCEEVDGKVTASTQAIQIR